MNIEESQKSLKKLENIHIDVDMSPLTDNLEKLHKQLRQLEDVDAEIYGYHNDILTDLDVHIVIPEIPDIDIEIPEIRLNLHDLQTDLERIKFDEITIPEKRIRELYLRFENWDRKSVQEQKRRKMFKIVL